MAKKLYSLRMDAELLETLRFRADQEGKTVSELIHNLLSEALGINPEERDKQAISHQDLAILMAKIKDELREELKEEMKALPH